MTAEDALSFLLSEYEFWREVPNASPDEREAWALNLPALARALDVRPMSPARRRIFRAEFRAMLTKDFRFDPQPSTVGCGD